MIAIKQMGQAVLPYLNINRVVTAYTVCQSGTNYVKFTPTNYNLLDRIQKIFACIDFFIVLFEILWPLLKIELIQVVLDLLNPYDFLVIIIAISPIAISSFIVVSSVNKYIDTKRDKKHFSEMPQKTNLKIQHHRSLNYMYLQMLLVARGIVTVSLTFLGMQTPLLCAISLAALSYSFYKQSCRKWINWTRNFNCPTGIQGNFEKQQIQSYNQLFEEFNLSHFFPLIEIQNRNELDEVCAVCLEGEDKPEVYFCESPKHIYHIRCLPEWLAGNSNILASHLQVKDRKLEKNNFLPNVVSYNIDLPESHLVGCPICRQSAVSQELCFSLKEKSGYKIDNHPTGFTSEGQINIIKTVKN